MNIRGYIDIALVVVILLLIIVVLWFWRLKDDSAKDLIAAQTVHVADVSTHNQDVATIVKITALRKSDDIVIAKFNGEIQSINDKFNNVQTSIANLRRINADVEKYLSQPIPVALRDVLNGMRDDKGSNFTFAH